MEELNAAPAPDEMAPEEPPTGSEEGISSDLTQGYQLTIIVRPEGFTVGDPEPIAAEPQSEEGGEAPGSEGDVIPDRTGMVKALLGVLEAHPLGDESSAPTGEQASKQMALGFGSSAQG